MIIPLGPEDREVRRIPWITVAILAANLLLYVLVSFSSWSRDAQLRAEGATRNFLDYWVEHPYLEMPSEYARYFGSARAERERKYIEKAQAVLAERGYRPDPMTLPAERKELEERAAEWVKAMQASPAWSLGFVPAHKTVVSLLTSMFMHGGWWHLIGNMIIFLMTAPLLEDRYGRVLFPLFYLAAGTAAAFAQVAKAPDSLVPLIGASGAIAGVTGAFTIRLFKTRMIYLVLPIPILFFFRFRVRVPAWIVFPFWFLEQVALNAIAPDAGVAWSAHIGGFLFGVAFAVAMKLFSVEEKWIHPAIEKEIGWEQHPALTKAGELRSMGNLEGAREQLKVGLAADPSNVDGWRALFDVCADLKDDAEAARAATRWLELLTSKGETDLALVASAEALDQVRVEAFPARFWFVAATAREKSGDARAAYEAYEALVTRFPADALAARALVKMSEILARANEPGLAWRLVTLAQSHPSCVEAWRAASDRVLASLPPEAAPSTVDEPIPARGRHVPRGTRTLPLASQLAAMPRMSPEATIVPRAPREPRPSSPGIAAPGTAAAATASPAPRRGFFTDSGAPAPSRAAARAPVRPAMLWSLGGLAAAAIATAGILVWEPWAKTAPAPSVDAALQPGAPLRSVVSAPPPSAAAAPAATAPSSSEPAPSTAAAAPSTAAPPASALPAAGALAGAEVPLRVTFQSPFAAGQVIVKGGEKTLLTKDFDFGKESAGGLLDEIVVVPSGGLDLKVWVTSRDRAVRAYATLAATIPPDEPKSLELTLAGDKLALAVK